MYKCSCSWENTIQGELTTFIQQLIPHRKLFLSLEVKVVNTRTVSWPKFYSKESGKAAEMLLLVILWG